MDSDDDDPTRALDDFVRRNRAAAQTAPDLSDLVRKITPDTVPAAAQARGGRLRSGERWSADDVVDVPLVELPAVAPPVDAGAQVPWQPDIDALMQRRARDPRLLGAWQPGCWIGAVRKVFDSTTEFARSDAGPVVETYPPHRLLLAWPPQGLGQPLLGRWPAQVRLSAVPVEDAADVLLAQLPDDALLWFNPAAQDADWALAAEIVLLHDPALRPFQLSGLRAFIDAERESSFALLNGGYAQDTAGGAVTRR